MSPLATTEGASTLTVTASSSFEMTFDASVAGGAVAKFYDLAEDPGRTNDLAGSLETSNGPRGLHSFGMAVGGISYNSSNNVAGARLDVLEATATRVRIRQEAFYQQGPAGAILAGQGDRRLQRLPGRQDGSPLGAPDHDRGHLHRRVQRARGPLHGRRRSTAWATSGN